MSDENEGPVFGSVAGSSTESAPPQEQGSPLEAQSPAAPDMSSINYDRLMAMLPEDLRVEKVFQNINRENPVEDMARQFFHAQKLVGVDKIEAPKQDWPKDKWDALYDRLGRPKSPDDYPMPAFPENVPMDDVIMKDIRQIAFEKGVTGDQLSAIIEKYSAHVGKQYTEATTQAEASIRQKLADFQADCGENFRQVLSEAERGFETFADDSLKELIRSDPALSNNPAIIRHFQKLARTAREDAVRTGDSSNPLNVNSPDQALSVLKKYEEDNALLLFKAPEQLTLADKEKRENVLKRREQLYKLAYAE